MAGVTGLEPATSGLTGQRSNQLSYTPMGTIRKCRQQTGFYRRSAPLSTPLSESARDRARRPSAEVDRSVRAWRLAPATTSLGVPSFWKHRRETHGR